MTATATTVRPFGIRDKIGYALGDFACNLSFTLLSTYMMLYYMQYMLIKETDWAWIIIVGKLWDAINDPIIGGMTDRVKIGKSKYKSWISIGSIGLVVCTTLVFLPIPQASYAVKILLCLLSYMIWSVFYTMVNVPYGSLHSAISDDPVHRSSLSTFRSVGAGVSMLIIMLLPSIVYDENKNLKGSMFIWLALAFSIVAFFALIGVNKLTTERVNVNQPIEKKKQNYFQVLLAFAKNRPIWALTIASMVQAICFVGAGSMNQIVFQSFFRDTDILTVVTIASYVPMVVVMFVLSKLVARFGKRNCVIVSCAVSLVGALGMLIFPFRPTPAGGEVDALSIAVWTIFLMIANIGNGLFGVIVWAMVVDCIDYQNLKTGQRDEGSIYSLYSFFRKLAQGIGSSLVALALGWLGYKKELGAAQPLDVATDIKTGYVLFLLIGLAIMLLSILIIYNIKKKDESRIHDELYKKPEVAPALEGDGATIPPEAEEQCQEKSVSQDSEQSDNEPFTYTDTKNDKADDNPDDEL